MNEGKRHQRSDNCRGYMRSIDAGSTHQDRKKATAHLKRDLLFDMRTGAQDLELQLMRIVVNEGGLEVKS